LGLGLVLAPVGVTQCSKLLSMNNTYLDWKSNATTNYLRIALGINA
jgi:hypothetical protein